MTKYIENVNMYLSVKKIKQTYISLKTGIDTKKLSRILTGIQDVTRLLFMRERQRRSRRRLPDSCWN